MVGVVEALDGEPLEDLVKVEEGQRLVDDTLQYVSEDDSRRLLPDHF